MQPFSLMEAAVYNLLRAIPLIMLAFYPFQDKRRFSAEITAFIYEVILVVWLALSLFNAFFYTGSTLVSAGVEITAFIVIAALYVFALKGHPGKMLFNCFMLVNVGYMTTVTSKCLEGYLFPQMVLDRYRWSASLCLCIVSPLIMYPVYRFMKWEKENLTQDIQQTYIWRYSWLVPVTFYLIWSHAFYGSGSPVTWATNIYNVIFLGIVNMASFLIYYLLMQMVRDNASYLKLREENHTMAVQLMQYDDLNQRIALARQGRHDLRHHILSLEAMANEGNIDGIRKYLKEVGEKYQLKGSLSYCSNMTVNAVLTFFSIEAQKADIQYDVSIGVPEDIKITKADLSILFGNLLENAVEACQRQTAGERRIQVRGQTTQSTLAVTIDNTYETAPEKDRRGRFRSMKHSGPGIGTESVKNIVARYNGVINFETKGDLFCVSVMLYLH